MVHKILCIEDNVHSRRLLRKLLQRRGYEVIDAQDGRSGLLLAYNEHPDMILTDINLPDMSGFQILEQVRANPHTRAIPVIAVTANCMVGDKENCLEKGFDAYIAKPIMRHELESVLNSRYAVPR